MERKFINLLEASRTLGVSAPTVYKLIQQGKLSAVKTGNKQRLDRSEVVELAKKGWVWTDADSQTD